MIEQWLTKICGRTILTQRKIGRETCNINEFSIHPSVDLKLSTHKLETMSYNTTKTKLVSLTQLLRYKTNKKKSSSGRTILTATVYYTKHILNLDKFICFFSIICS